MSSAPDAPGQHRSVMSQALPYVLAQLTRLSEALSIICERLNPARGWCIPSSRTPVGDRFA